LLWALFGLLLLVALTLVPLRVDFSIQHGREPPSSAEVRWGGLRLPERTPAAAADASRPKPTQRTPRRVIRHVLRTKGLAAAAARLAVRLIQQVQVREARLEVRLGLADPADTGQLWATLAPALAVLSSRSDACISLTPEFSRPCCELAGRANLQVIPARLLLAVGRTLLSLPPWRALWRFFVA